MSDFRQCSHIPHVALEAPPHACTPQRALNYPRNHLNTEYTGYISKSKHLSRIRAITDILILFVDRAADNALVNPKGIAQKLGLESTRKLTATM